MKRPAEPLSPAEVGALLEACGSGTLVALRNRALLVTLWRAGLRCAEALALRPVDVDLPGCTIRVLHGKGDRARVVAIDERAAAVIGDWLAARSGAGLNGGPLFCAVVRDPGSALSPRYIRSLVGRLGKRAGVGHRCHPHALRHGYAVDLSRAGWPLRLISDQLGHSSVATTDIYLRGLHPSEALERARSRPWGEAS